MEWIVDNKEWLFSGIGVAALTAILYFIKGQKPVPATSNQATITIHNNNSNGNGNGNGNEHPSPYPRKEKTLQDYKNETKILFIDDDTKFKAAKILSKSGWVHTKLIKDAETLEIQDIIEADILFIDVQGVGIAMGFNDEGLGLALAVKKKYPQKKIIVYSAETHGNRFHEALRKADNFLAKNADPYEFQQIVEDYTIGTQYEK